MHVHSTTHFLWQCTPPRPFSLQSARALRVQQESTAGHLAARIAPLEAAAEEAAARLAGLEGAAGEQGAALADAGERVR